MLTKFEKEKQDFLKKKDKSTKGKIDKGIVEVINEINSLPDYYTTSSCSGRIVLLDTQEKRISKWLFVSHAPIKKVDIKKECWFLQEPPIIHVKCKDIGAAEKILAAAQQSGLKKSGLVSLKKIVLEVKSAEKMETLLTPKLDKEYIQLLVYESNKKLLKGRKNLDKFLKALRKDFH